MPDLIGHLNPKTMQKKGYIYFMTNQTNKVLYTGVTNSLKRRAREHFEGHGSVFTSKYNCNKLVYFEQLPSIEQAISQTQPSPQLIRQSPPTCTAVITDLSVSHPRPDRGSPRLRSRAGREKKPAKRMAMGTCYAGFHGHAD